LFQDNASTPLVILKQVQDDGWRLIRMKAGVESGRRLALNQDDDWR
jgi:hypothetical protein